MDHLFSSRVKVQRLQLEVQDGKTSFHHWVDQEGVLANVKCRLDLLFVRPGKDVPPAVNAGVAQDRVGLMFCSAKVPLQAGDRIVTISGPIDGTFEIRNIPDKALNMTSAHHIEVQIIETSQTLSQEDPTPFPSEDNEPLPETPDFD